MPAVPPPGGTSVRTPIELKLKRGWRYDERRRTFRSAAGEEYSTRGALPSGSRIVYKVPSLVVADEARLSRHEKALRLYMQLILPTGASPAKYLDAVRAWPCVAEAELGPDVSLPSQG